MNAHQLPSDPCTVIFLQRKPHKAHTLGIFRNTHNQRRMLSFNAAGVRGGHSFKKCEFATDEGNGRDGPRPGALIQLTLHSIVKAAFLHEAPRRDGPGN